ncbi:MAG: phosphatidate cytidylyltransferase [Verrucomicrobiota bacterium]
MADTPPTPSSSHAIVFARRSASTVFLWGLVSAVFFSRSSWAYLGLLGLLSIIATVEYFRLLRAAGVRGFPRFGILLATGYCGTLHAFFLHGQAPPADLEAVAVVVAVAGAFALQLRQPIRGVESLLAVAATVLGLVYIAVLFNFAARLIFLVPGGSATPGTIGEPGAYLLLWLLAVTKFTDMGAYITGSLIGRHKMIPHVSPGKTWEGFGGALLFAQLAGCGLYAAFPAPLAVLGSARHVIALGLLLAVLAVIGDLAESVLKRALGAKDSGRMLPGIGGALDLIDSICFTAPALYFYLKWFLLPTA